MTMNPGTRLGPYEIVATIGAGGMGEVYKARDTRLDRAVAVKILPAEFAADAKLKLRFEREAKTISHLSHPNICTLYDVGENYIVMELLEGESLADRLARGPLPVPEVLKYGVQIADALGKAHREGVIHRDLKPGNVMITKSGAKLLDFGLAKSAIVFGAPESATVQKPLTEEGTILGTFQYMAPEQLGGEEPDARTDIFALGALLYEMATGKRAFEGKTRTSLIGAIVSGEPKSITEIQPLTPPALEHVIKKCLAKDRDDRWQSASDVAEQLKWILMAGSQAGVAAPLTIRRRTRERLAWILFAIAAAGALVSATAWLRIAKTPKPAVRLTLMPPPSAVITPPDLLGLALSPDGSRLAFSAWSKDGKRALWIRPLDAANATRLPETEDASYPFWSPDGRYLAFFAEGKLKKIDLAGGSPRVLCDAPSGRGGTWGPDGTIVIAPSLRSGIYKISANGGTLTPVIADAKEITFRWPHLLPDGKHFLYVTRASATDAPVGQLYVSSIDGGNSKFLLKEASNAAYVDAGYIVYGRGEDLVAQRFDLGKLEVTGEPVTIVPDKVFYFEPKNYTIYSVARNLRLVYQPSVFSPAQMAWYGRDGMRLESFGAPGFIGSVDLSHDGKKIALIRGSGSSSDVWVYDIAQARETRLTHMGGRLDSARWSPDGSQILFGHTAKRVPDIYLQAVSGGEPELVVESQFWKTNLSWFPDGKSFVFVEQSPVTNYDLWACSLKDRSRRVLIRTPFEELNPSVSPDGQSIVYRSNETGRSEIYRRPIAGSGPQVQISTDGATGSFWRADGRELFYVATDRTVMAVAMPGGSRGEPGAPKRLFQAPRGSTVQDVSNDGQRFLVTVPVDDPGTPAFEVVLNWESLLNRQTAGQQE